MTSHTPWTLAALAGLALAAPLALRAAPVTIKVVDEAGTPVPDVAVSVYVNGAPRRVAAAATPAEMSQQKKRFVPGLLIVQTGTPVSFPNHDSVRHHVYSFSPAKTFEIKLYAGTPTEPIVFDKPGTAVLGCNIHDSMIGYVHVVDTPYFGRTDERGQTQLDLPPGSHKARLWHARMRPEAEPAAQPLEAGGAAAVVLTMKP